ncbi:MAG: alpha/beta hydrolase [Massilia sp.]
MKFAKTALTTLCGCLLAGAVLAVEPLAAPAAAAGPAPVPVAPGKPYNAETTFEKLRAAYPGIKIARKDTGTAVRVVKDLDYVRYGARALQLDLYVPTDAADSPHPAIVLVHGGGWRNGDRQEFAPMAARMAERGYVAAVISYRLSPEAPYPAAIHDVKAAVRFLRVVAVQFGIDPARIAVAGGSAGGQIASLTGVTNGLDRFDPQAAGSKVSSAVQAIVNIDGLSDFTSEAARANEDKTGDKLSSAGAWFGGGYAEKQALWREASPTFYVGKTTPPILFIGSGQARFAVGREAMVEKLTAAGVNSRVLLLPDTPHSFWLFDPWLDPTVNATVDFLDQRFGLRQPRR